MANNTYTNKVVLGNETLIDLTSDTATADDVLPGKTFHLSSGAPGTGSAGAVMYDRVQSLTSAQGQQARENIGAGAAVDIGDLTDLDTTDASSLVDAINEVVGDIGDVAGDLSTEVTRATGVEGSLSNLTTTAQGNLVAAINEVHKKALTVIFTTPSFSSLPQTFSDIQVTFGGSITHLTPDLAVTPNDYKLSNTGAMSGTWELDFSVEGYVTIRGTYSGSTGTTLKVWASHS